MWGGEESLSTYSSMLSQPFEEAETNLLHDTNADVIIWQEWQLRIRNTSTQAWIDR